MKAKDTVTMAMPQWRENNHTELVLSIAPTGVRKSTAVSPSDCDNFLVIFL